MKNEDKKKRDKRGGFVGSQRGEDPDMYGGAHHNRSLNSSPSKINSPFLHPSKTLTTFALTSLSYSSQSVTPMSYRMVDSIHPFRNHNFTICICLLFLLLHLFPFFRYSLFFLSRFT